MDKCEKKILVYLKKKQESMQKEEFTLENYGFLHLATISSDLNLKQNDMYFHLLKQRGFIEFDANTNTRPNLVRITPKGIDALAPLWVRERVAFIGWTIGIIAVSISIIASCASWWSAKSSEKAQTLLNRDLSLRYEPSIILQSLEDGSGYAIRNTGDFAILLVSRQVILIGKETKFYPSDEGETRLVASEIITNEYAPEQKESVEKLSGKGSVIIKCVFRSLFDKSTVSFIREFRYDVVTGKWRTSPMTSEEWDKIMKQIKKIANQ